MTVSLENLAVREIMTPSVVTLEPDMTLREAIGVLDDREISGAPVMAAGAVLGVLSATDVLAFEAGTPGVPTADQSRVQDPAVGTEEPQRDETHPVSAYFTDIWDNAGSDVLERMRTTESPEWDVLNEHVVSEAMSTTTRTVSAEMLLPDAAAYMVSEGVHRALVMEGERLVGVVTSTDFLRALAERAETRRGAGSPAPGRQPPSRRKETPAAD